MNRSRLYFGLGVATSAGAIELWFGVRKIWRDHQEHKKGVRVPPDLYFNEKGAQELAQATEPRSLLNPNDLKTVFKLTDTEASRVYHQLISRREGETFRHPLFINFNHLPIRSASQCADGGTPRENGTEESCFVVKTTRDYSDYFPGNSWTSQNLEKIRAWLRSLELWTPASLITFTDCDDTLWAQGVNYAVLRTAVDMKLVPKERAEELNARYNRGDHDQAYAYMTEEVYAGLTLNQVYAAFQKAKTSPFFPKVYDEMRQLVNHLWGQGITVGYVSAAPFFISAPMLEESGFNAPLWAIEGNDVFVVPPDNPSATPVKLSNLVQSGGFKNWAEVLGKLGGYKIVSREMDQIVSRKGKGTAARSILERHVIDWNNHRKTNVSSQVRVAGVFGDNFAPFSDLQWSKPIENGNDQGMIRAAPLMPGALLLNITEVEETEKGIALSKKGRKKLDEFNAFRGQLELTEPNLIPLSQQAIRTRGVFSQ
ncbi:MAG: haloacid dehalogenase-like hydrolase [Deltaproteobacteria bacterium]|nr:haloacid dehalogenase-like hydrolase [Deltaproteobacteria bacterium]